MNYFDDGFITQEQIDNDVDLQEVLPGISAQGLKEVSTAILDCGYERPKFSFNDIDEAHNLGKQLYQIVLRQTQRHRTPVMSRRISEAGLLINSENESDLITGMTILYDLSEGSYG